MLGVNSPRPSTRSIKLAIPKIQCRCFLLLGSSVGILNAFFEGGVTELFQHTIQSSIIVGIPTVYLATAAAVMLLVAVLRVASLLRWFLYLLVLACERYNRENDFLDELVRSMNAPIIGSLSRPVTTVATKHHQQSGNRTTDLA